MATPTDEIKIDINTGDAAFNQSRRAEAVLDHILDAELSPEAKRRANYVNVKEELSGRPVIDIDTGRTKSRVLFITTNEHVLEPNSSAQREYTDLKGVFDEVHVMVLIPREGAVNHKRVAKNAWVYQVHAKHWWRLPWEAAIQAYDTLTFNKAPRPDIIVARDPFESGLAAYFIASDFARPVQVHIERDFLRKSFLEESKENKWRKRMAHYVLKRVSSVRTNTETLKDKIAKKYKKIVDLNTLPQFYNFAGLLDAKPATDVHNIYKQFTFVMVAFGPLTADSYLHDAFTAMRSHLLNHKIGLIIVGTGPAKHLFVKKAELLGVTKNVVFIEEPKDTVALLKTADLLVQTGTDKDSERVVLQAAAAGLPMAAYVTDLRQDLFKDGASASLSEPDDVHALSQNVTKLLNSQATRIEYHRNVQDIARNRLHEDPEAYFQAFRDTIEVILVPPESEKSDKLEEAEKDSKKDKKGKEDKTNEPEDKHDQEKATNTDTNS